MPQTIYLPKAQSPWEQFLPQILSNLILSKTTDIYRQKAEEREELRQYKRAGYQEVPKGIGGAIKVGDKYFRAPEEKIESIPIEGIGQAVVIRRGNRLIPVGIAKPTVPKGPQSFKIPSMDAKGNPTWLSFYQDPQTMEWKQIKSPRFKPTTEVNIDMTKRTQGNLEDVIVQGQKVLDMTERVKKLYKPEYLEYGGKGKAWIENKLSKLGMNKAQFARERAKWALEIDRHTLEWRKFITGVAGSPQEMETIEKTTINTRYDSPAQFEAKIAYMPIITKAAMQRAQYLLNKGFKNPSMAPLSAKQEAAQKFPYPKIRTEETLTPEQEAQQYLQMKGESY